MGVSRVGVSAPLGNRNQPRGKSAPTWTRGRADKPCTVKRVGVSRHGREISPERGQKPLYLDERSTAMGGGPPPGVYMPPCICLPGYMYTGGVWGGVAPPAGGYGGRHALRAGGSGVLPRGVGYGCSPADRRLLFDRFRSKRTLSGSRGTLVARRDPPGQLTRGKLSPGGGALGEGEMRGIDTPFRVCQSSQPPGR